MLVYDNLGSVVAGVFVAGVATHFLRRWRERRFYVDFRSAYEASVRRVQETNCAPAAVVRCKELEREFMRLSFPPWFWGLGRWVWAVVKVCVAAALLAFILAGAIGAP